MNGMLDVALAYGFGFQSGLLVVSWWTRLRHRDRPPTRYPWPTEPEPHRPQLPAHCHCGELR
jgi:hypothetical protein